MWQKIGGRKFLMALIVMGIGAAVELMTERGLTQHFTALLTLVYISFSAANFAVSKTFMNTKKGGQPGVDKQALNNLKSEVQDVRSTADEAVNAIKQTHKVLVGALVNGGNNQQVPR